MACFYSATLAWNPTGVDKGLTVPVVGGDIVELNPDRDINGMTAAVAAKLVKELAAVVAVKR